MALINNPTPRYGALGGRGGFPLAQTGAGFLAQRGGLLSGVNPQVANQPLATPVDPGVLPPLVPTNSSQLPPVEPPVAPSGSDVPPPANPTNSSQLPPIESPGPQNPVNPNPNHPLVDTPLQAPPPPVAPPGDFTVRYVPGLNPAAPLPTAPGPNPTGGENLDTLTNGSHAPSPAGDPVGLAGRANPFVFSEPGGSAGTASPYPEPPTLPQYGGNVNDFRSYYGMAPLQNNSGSANVNTQGNSLANATAPGGAVAGAPTSRTGPVRSTNPNDVPAGAPGGNLQGLPNPKPQLIPAPNTNPPYDVNNVPGSFRPGLAAPAVPTARAGMAPRGIAAPIANAGAPPTTSSPELPPNDMGNSATAGVGASTNPVGRTLADDQKARRR